MSSPRKRPKPTPLSPALLEARRAFREACQLLFQPEDEQSSTWETDVLAKLARAVTLADAIATAGPGPRSLKNPRWISALAHIDAASIQKSHEAAGRARARCALALALRSHPKSIEAHAQLASLVRFDAADAAAMAALEKHLSAAVELGSAINWDKKLSSSNGASVAIHDREHEAYGPAREALALLLCQSGRSEAAAAHLTAIGFDYRLSSAVFAYSVAPLASLTIAQHLTSTAPLRVLNDALPPTLLAALQRALGDASPFWREHNYNQLGGEYFSYLHDLPAVLSNPRTVIEQTMRHVHGLAQVNSY
jgi:hypothetical protein